MIHQKVVVADAFTSTAFGGNPAAICVLENSTYDDEILLKIAREMNLSETAFVQKIGEDKDKDQSVFNLRWFTPTTEVDLCGHATLATSHVLFETYPNLCSTLVFKTKSGDLFVQRTQGKLQMNFPRGQPIPVRFVEAHMISLCKALGLDRTRVKDSWFCQRTKKLVLEVESTEDIDKVHPSTSALLELELEADKEITVRGVIVTTNNTKQTERYAKYDFVSRYFSPWNGIPEDPVTGSAHTVLAVYWSEKTKGEKFNAFQASARGGELEVELLPENRVGLRGEAVTVLTGELHF